MSFWWLLYATAGLTRARHIHQHHFLQGDQVPWLVEAPPDVKGFRACPQPPNWICGSDEGTESLPCTWRPCSNEWYPWTVSSIETSFAQLQRESSSIDRDLSGQTLLQVHSATLCAVSHRHGEELVGHSDCHAIVEELRSEHCYHSSHLLSHWKIVWTV